METERQRQARKTKNKIYQSARKLIGKKGYDNVKVSDICEDAGVSTGLFYNYFPTKSYIYVEGERLFDRQVQKFMMEHRHLRGKEKLALLIDLYMGVTVDGGYPYSTYYISAQLNDSNGDSVGIFQQLKLAVLQSIKEMAEDKLLKGDVSEIQTLLICFLNGVIRDWCIAKGALDLKTLGRKVMDIVLTYYQA